MLESIVQYLQNVQPLACRGLALSEQARSVTDWRRKEAGDGRAEGSAAAGRQRASCNTHLTLMAQVLVLAGLIYLPSGEKDSEMSG